MTVTARLLAILAIFTWVLPDVPARANDSTAVLKSGQLQLTTSPEIAMEREDLYLSTREIRVKYRFRNTSKQDVTTLVAFPLPDIVIGDDTNYSVENSDPVNFIGFKVNVNGTEIAPSIQLRATRFGIDQTQLLKRHDIPVLPFSDGFYKSLERVSPVARDELERAGLVDWHSSWGANNVPLPNPHWRAHLVYYWQQTFPANAIAEVSHSYRPVPGVGFFGVDLLEDKTFRETYCMDKGFRAAAAKRYGKGEASMHELHYVLTTGANWQGNIGEFHLTIDKGKPGNLVSLCIDGIRKTGPTTFEAVKKDFFPERDLKIVIISPLQP